MAKQEVNAEDTETPRTQRQCDTWLVTAEKLSRKKEPTNCYEDATETV